ncbi:MAG: hypothetical protein QM756_36340 [Polyangiaceae bacterium]
MMSNSRFAAAVTLASSLLFSVVASAQAGKKCDLNTDKGCWRQITFTNFKDFAVGNGLICMVGGGANPFVGDATHPPSDQYLHPNNYTENTGNEDVIECHKPLGTSGYSNEPYYPGYNGMPYVPSRVPDGIYDDGVWGGTPTGVIALYGGPDGDDIAVLTQKQHVYVAAGSRDTFYSPGNYNTFQLDRKNIRADTGATICIKGLFSQMGAMSNSWVLGAHGCNGEVYFAFEGTYRGWLVGYQGPYKDIAGGIGWFYAITSANQVYASTYRFSANLAALPAGTPKYIGDHYAISSAGVSSRVYQWAPATQLWSARDVGYPYDVKIDELDEIENGERFRGIAGEFFVHQFANRVYLYSP